jgi:membrane-bound serine protease (ClpP class)
MSITQLIAAAAALTVLVITPAAVLAVLSRRKKAVTVEPHMVGSRGCVETTLRPEGSVLIRGELWRARSRSGSKIERGQEIRVVGASGHLLEVEFAR